MRLSIEEITENSISFVVEANYSFANAIRRILLGEVPAIAVDIVEIKENNTVLADEILANRIGLVPISSSRQLVLRDECDCDAHCERCAIILNLKVKNTGKEIKTVTGKDMATEERGVSCFNSLIVKLAPGQSLDIKCIVRKDTPKTHSKYSSVTCVGFKAESANPELEDEIGDCSRVRMDIELLEGGAKPKEVLLAALEIFKTKLANILDEISQK